MIFVVEIASRAGIRAGKEYDASSFNAAVEAVTRELRGYPEFRVIDVRIKGDGAFQQEADAEEEW
jgi:hypothetical protein